MYALMEVIMRKIVAVLLLLVLMSGVVLSTIPHFAYASGNPTEPTPPGNPEPPPPPDD
jgi:hypothetical protein